MSVLRTLIVDDDIAVARVHREFVSLLDGFVVVGEAHTGGSALAEIERLKPDLVLLDIYLPDLTGLEVLKRIRAGSSPDLDVIAVTAARDLESVRQAGMGGVRHYLVKPFPLQALRERLEDVRRYRISLSHADPQQHLDQRAVDALLTGPEMARRLAPLPKGLAAHSLGRVLDELHSSEADSSATEIAERVGMSRVSARRYLEHLVAIGRAAVVPRYGAIGRPENRYAARD